MTSVRAGYRELQGIEVPLFLYGTAWKEERTEALTARALEAGFVGIDTANQRKHYVEAAVGAAVSRHIAAGRSPRSDLFLQTKFTFQDGQDHRLPYERSAAVPVQVAQSFESSLAHLGTDYVDSYVLHGPSSSRGLTRADREAWRAMEAIHASKGTRYLGVSNVSLEQLRALCEAVTVKPTFVQNRCYATRGWDRPVRAFCREHGIVYQGFSLLTANRRELESPSIRSVSQRLGCSPAEVVFGFAIASGILPLTGTSSPAHMRLDLGSAALQLDRDDITAIEGVSG